jgi:hypothetical protein
MIHRNSGGVGERYEGMERGRGRKAPELSNMFIQVES